MTVYIAPRIWGRVYTIQPSDDNPIGVYTWQAVTPDADGNADYVYITDLVQVLAGSPGESPFYSNYGIPGQQSVIQQLFPDFYANLTQTQFAQFFAALTITRVTPTDQAVGPYYKVNITRHNGSKYMANVPT